MTEVEKQIEEVMMIIRDYGDSRRDFATISADKELQIIKDKLRTLLSSAQTRITSLEALLKFADFPMGAIENGRTRIDRIENKYSFECEAGPIRNCSDWDELKRDFEYMADYLLSRTHQAPALEVEVEVERQKKVIDALKSLHNSIMNLPLGKLPHVGATDNEVLAYKIGHRDARHAAAELAASQPNGEANPAFYFDMDDDDEDGTPGFHTVKECIEYTVERRELEAGAVVSVGVFHKEGSEDKEPDFHCSVEIISNDPELENQPVWVAKPNGEAA